MTHTPRKRTTAALRERPSWYTADTDQLLRQITQRIVKAFHPDKIILFGSYAYGKPTYDSDLDLLVVAHNNANQTSFERERRVYALFLDRAFPMDILVRSPQEITRRLEIGDPFIQEIIARGRTVYERHSRGVGAKGRNGLSGSARSRPTPKKTAS